MAFTGSLFAQDTPVLKAYYQVKDDLVKSNSAEVQTHATAMVKAIDALDLSASTDLKSKLLFDARHLTESKELDHQREHFASLTANFSKLNKVYKLTSQPIYVDFCPMKKVYWLSSEEAIKNPYYGSAMLTCGQVKQVMNK